MPPAKLISLDEAAALVPRGARIMVGGFGLVGKPVALVERLLDHPEATELTVISNNVGEPGKGLGRLLAEGRIAKAIGSYFTSNRDAVVAHAEGRLEVELLPQGTMAEAIRAGGAGIAAFYVPTGAGTLIARGREIRAFDGVDHVLQHALRADVALLRARRADALGNLVYDKTARNFNPDMATAADLVIAQVDEIVPVGGIDPEAVVTPHLLVDHLVLTPMSVQRDIARRVARHLRAGEVVNLGIGIPTLVADFLAADAGVVLQTENGMLGVGPAPGEGEADPALVNAGKLPITALPGASYFSSSVSFGLIRGGHVATSVLGALQIDGRGRIANWALPGRPILGVGGAMDLLVGARRVIAATTHTTKDGEPKLVAECALPLTAERPADLIVTEAATFALGDGGLVLVEIAPGFDADWIAARTGAPYTEALP